MKKTAIVICPGRGSYHREELGYFAKYHQDKHLFLSQMDEYRQRHDQCTITELDTAQRFRFNTHTTGDNASALIYSCAIADFMSIDREAIEIVAISGNSMGWYLALAAGAAVDLSSGMHIVNTMGTLMHQHGQGGQLIYPLCDDNWVFDPALEQQLNECLAHAAEHFAVYQSINLGMMAVIAGDPGGIQFLMESLPKAQQRFPLLLPHHAAFHTPLMEPVSAMGQQVLSPELFSSPSIPLIDGRGHIWQPHGTDSQQLYDYTFCHQVCQTYDYSKAIEVCCKEFAPDYLILLGPGTSLSGPSAQQLINMRWKNIVDKTTFKTQQAQQPFIISMGIDEQRALVTH